MHGGPDLDSVRPTTPRTACATTESSFAPVATDSIRSAEGPKRRGQEIGGPREWKAARGDCGTAKTGAIVRLIDDSASASGKAGGAEASA